MRKGIIISIEFIYTEIIYLNTDFDKKFMNMTEYTYYTYTRIH